jgi:hypothetical protein
MLKGFYRVYQKKVDNFETALKSVHVTKFLINMDCLGTYNVEETNIFVKINFPEQGGGCLF